MDNPDYKKIEYIQETIKNILDVAGFRSRVEYEQSLIKGLVFNIFVDSPRQLIGKQGNVLLSLEHLLFAMINRQFSRDEEQIRFSIDIDDYRSKREWQLKQQVKDIVSDLKLGKNYVLMQAMPRHERKFVHSYIQEQFPHLTTSSTGEEPNRKIKIII